MSKKIILSKDETENPKLGACILANGTQSLFLEYYLGYTKDENGKIKKRRKLETLKLYLSASPKTPVERMQNKQTLELAKKIRYERQQQFTEDMQGYRTSIDARGLDLFTLMDKYLEQKQNANKNVITAAMCSFKRYIKEDYLIGTEVFYLRNLSDDVMFNYVEWLKHHTNGGTAAVYFGKIKSMLAWLKDKTLIKRDYCKNITIKTDKSVIKKDILTMEEISSLAKTMNSDTPKNNMIRRAFIFSCYTGIRYCDIKELTYHNVDYSMRILTFDQKKTANRSSRSAVIIPLTDGLINLIGHSKDDNARIFPLPISCDVNIQLKAWAKESGVNKHLSYHCARHSFAVNVLSRGADIKTVSSLLGHSSLVMTEKYTRVVDELKQKAIQSLPDLF